LVRSLLESLALKYRYVIDQLRIVLGHPIAKIHVIGGGSRNALLCQFTADATGLPVVAGPAEATAIGNILVPTRDVGRIPLSQLASIEVAEGASIIARRENRRQITVRTNIRGRDQAALWPRRSAAAGRPAARKR
jgi:sugar (pentulose or hexulose) kinase